ncbi:hypothetical protein [Paracoccus sp. 22332]|uniref:hypothetical protein n=1 Tax=Paracoccus sp. 22332 TaxID=3453913 RepID=UPI003F865F05
MKLRDKLPGSNRKQFPPQAYQQFDVVSNEQIAEWQKKITEKHKLDEGDWELVDGVEAC